MAEEFDQSRTEAPTPRRREQARQQGQVALSAELSTGMLLLAAVVVLSLSAPTLGGGLLAGLRLDLRNLRSLDLTIEQAQHMLATLLGQGVELLGVFFGVLLVVGLGMNTLQVGFHVTPELLGLRWEKLSLAQGWTRLLSLASIMRGFFAVLKLGLVVLLAVWVLRGRATQIMTLGGGPLAQSTTQAWSLAIRLALAVAAALVILGVADYGFQRWRHERALLMTRQEMKEEVKQEEGDPQIKARIRKLQREVSRRRMWEDVPRAAVVITNPTHLAIALRYDRGVMTAPRVVAKGAGHVALHLVDLARRHAVPVVERQPLAQALYKAVKVGQDIPLALYYAVAEVLAYVYRLRGEPRASAPGGLPGGLSSGG